MNKKTSEFTFIKEKLFAVIIEKFPQINVYFQKHHDKIFGSHHSLLLEKRPVWKILEWERWSDYIGFWRWAVPRYQNHRAVCPLVWKEDANKCLHMIRPRPSVHRLPHADISNKCLNKKFLKKWKFPLDFSLPMWYNPLAIKQRPRRPGCVHLFNRWSILNHRKFPLDNPGRMWYNPGVIDERRTATASGDEQRITFPMLPLDERRTATASYGTTISW